MSTQLDLALRNAAQHLLDATVQVDAVTSSVSFVAAVVEGRRRVDEALAVHGASERGVEADRAENRGASLRFDEARQAAVDEVIWLRGHVINGLLELRPEVKSSLGAGELARRERVVSSVFGEDLSGLRTGAASMVRTSLDGVAARLRSASSADVSEADAVPLLSKVEALGLAFEGLLAEGLDDAVLAEGLAVARDRLNTSTLGLQRLVEGVLRLEGSGLSVEEFVRRRRRRRVAGAEPAEGGDVVVVGGGLDGGEPADG